VMILISLTVLPSLKHLMMNLYLQSTGPGELVVPICCQCLFSIKTLNSDLAATIHPIDHSRGPAHAPPDLRDEESGKLLFVEAEKLEIFFNGPVLRCVES
jgi:hypothetical protein